MVQSTELKTSFKQRLGIIIVAIVLLGSTVGIYMGIVLGYNNGTSASTADTTAKQARFQELYEEYEAEVSVAATELSSKYFDTFVEHKDRVKSFNAAAITDISHVDLVEGTGTEVTDESFADYSAYYIGWISDETVFDTSLDSFETPTALKYPLAGGNMIEGWNQGIVGMKIGGIREISIPSELAYGDQEQGSIPANSPLKFIVMLIDPAEDVDWSEEMYELYYELYATE